MFENGTNFDRTHLFWRYDIPLNILNVTIVSASAVFYFNNNHNLYCEISFFMDTSDEYVMS